MDGQRLCFCNICKYECCYAQKYWPKYCIETEYSLEIKYGIETKYSINMLSYYFVIIGIWLLLCSKLLNIIYSI